MHKITEVLKPFRIITAWKSRGFEKILLLHMSSGKETVLNGVPISKAIQAIRSVSETKGEYRFHPRTHCV